MNDILQRIQENKQNFANKKREMVMSRVNVKFSRNPKIESLVSQSVSNRPTSMATIHKYVLKKNFTDSLNKKLLKLPTLPLHREKGFSPNYGKNEKKIIDEDDPDEEDIKKIANDIMNRSFSKAKKNAKQKKEKMIELNIKEAFWTVPKNPTANDLKKLDLDDDKDDKDPYNLKGYYDQNYPEGDQGGDVGDQIDDDESDNYKYLKMSDDMVEKELESRNYNTYTLMKAIEDVNDNIISIENDKSFTNEKEKNKTRLHMIKIQKGLVSIFSKKFSSTEKRTSLIYEGEVFLSGQYKAITSLYGSEISKNLEITNGVILKLINDPSYFPEEDEEDAMKEINKYFKNKHGEKYISQNNYGKYVLYEGAPFTLKYDKTPPDSTSYTIPKAPPIPVASKPDSKPVSRAASPIPIDSASSPPPQSSEKKKNEIISPKIDPFKLKKEDEEDDDDIIKKIDENNKLNSIFKAKHLSTMFGSKKIGNDLIISSEESEIFYKYTKDLTVTAKLNPGIYDLAILYPNIAKYIDNTKYDDIKKDYVIKILEDEYPKLLENETKKNKEYEEKTKQKNEKKEKYKQMKKDAISEINKRNNEFFIKYDHDKNYSRDELEKYIEELIVRSKILEPVRIYNDKNNILDPDWDRQTGIISNIKDYKKDFNKRLKQLQEEEKKNVKKISEEKVDFVFPSVPGNESSSPVIITKSIEEIDNEKIEHAHQEAEEHEKLSEDFNKKVESAPNSIVIKYMLNTVYEQMFIEALENKQQIIIDKLDYLEDALKDFKKGDFVYIRELVNNIRKEEAENKAAEEETIKKKQEEESKKKADEEETKKKATEEAAAEKDKEEADKMKTAFAAFEEIWKNNVSQTNNKKFNSKTMKTFFFEAKKWDDLSKVLGGPTFFRTTFIDKQPNPEEHIPNFRFSTLPPSYIKTAKIKNLIIAEAKRKEKGKGKEIEIEDDFGDFENTETIVLSAPIKKEEIKKEEIKKAMNEIFNTPDKKPKKRDRSNTPSSSTPFQGQSKKTLVLDAQEAVKLLPDPEESKDEKYEQLISNLEINPLQKKLPPNVTYLDIKKMIEKNDNRMYFLKEYVIDRKNEKSKNYNKVVDDYNETRRINTSLEKQFKLQTIKQNLNPLGKSPKKGSK